MARARVVPYEVPQPTSASKRARQVDSPHPRKNPTLHLSNPLTVDGTDHATKARTAERCLHAHDCLYDSEPTLLQRTGAAPHHASVPRRAGSAVPHTRRAAASQMSEHAARCTRGLGSGTTPRDNYSPRPTWTRVPVPTGTARRSHAFGLQARPSARPAVSWTWASTPVAPSARLATHAMAPAVDRAHTAAILSPLQLPPSAYDSYTRRAYESRMTSTRASPTPRAPSPPSCRVTSARAPQTTTPAHCILTPWDSRARRTHNGSSRNDAHARRARHLHLRTSESAHRRTQAATKLENGAGRRGWDPGIIVNHAAVVAAQEALRRW
ncbi:hypothetical protein C8R44DRAFT_726055 [Mycena epipterygia]|nr:hypothetical protein C8R44DRAFT_726055 [Mycena epipterygia]